MFDQESGLNNNGFRDYAPRFGRYVQSDPLGLAVGVNTYGYVGQNPFLAVDPMGLAPGDIYAVTPASAINGGINTFFQRYFFGETGAQYSHLALEINSASDGTRYVMQSNPGVGVQIIMMQEFAVGELGRGSTIDRYTPIVPLTVGQLSALTQQAQKLAGTPYNNNIVFNMTASGTLSCAEAVQSAYGGASIPGIMNYSPISPTLPMDISSSPYFMRTSTEPFMSYP